MPVKTTITERMITDFCRNRIAPYLLPAHVEALRKNLLAAVSTGAGIPRHSGKYDWLAMGMLTNVPEQAGLVACCRYHPARVTSHRAHRSRNTSATFAFTSSQLAL